MFCPKCGKKNEDDAGFCEDCGISLEKNKTALHVTQSNIVSLLRHPKEDTYFLVAAIAGGIVWLGLIWLVILFFWIAIPAIIGLWLSEQFFKSRLLGNSIRISQGQYPDIYEIIQQQSKTLNINPPEVFIYYSQGSKNAFAMKLIKTKYGILFSDLIDIMLSHNSLLELSAIIGHEIGHHAAGHTAIWKRLLLTPAMFVPFLGPAYFRACELTADRIGMYLCGDKEAAYRALITLACGSFVLAPKTNINEFKEQESLLSPFFAFLNDLWSTHPRITKRVLALEEASHILKSS